MWCTTMVHAFVCDGYKEGDYFHINWGWGGQFNGYYRLSVLSPREYGFKQLPSIYTREQELSSDSDQAKVLMYFPKLLTSKR